MVENSFDAERRLALSIAGFNYQDFVFENSFDAERRLALLEKRLIALEVKLKIPLMPKGV